MIMKKMSFECFRNSASLCKLAKPPWVLLVLICAVFGNHVLAEDFAAAAAAGKIKVSFRGTGGSSGDAVEAIVTRTESDGGALELTIAPGTRLQSGDKSAQSMVIAAVRGQSMGEGSYSPGSVIEIGRGTKTYVLEAYCSDFEKDNPSLATTFTLKPADPLLACILTSASNLSTPAKQAAVWIYTDKASFSLVNTKFEVSRSDWDAAAAVVKKCSSEEQPNKAKPRSKEH
jgi:hypothetical protein